MEKWIREIIFNTLQPILSNYTKKIDNNFENKKVMKYYINQIQNIIDFVDGVNN